MPHRPLYIVTTGRCNHAVPVSVFIGLSTSLSNGIMYSKFIIVLATVCIANASVVINVFDDDPDIGVKSNEKDCNPTACDQLCRRLKFPGGVCVNGRCKCDNFLSENDVEPEISNYSQLEDLGIKDGPETDSVVKKTECNPIFCDDRCRKLKFPSGACVKGHCKCDHTHNAEEAVLELSPSDLEAISSLEDEPLSEVDEAERSSCSLSACEQYCHRLKLPGGACVNGRCKCDKFLSDQDELENGFSANDCNPTACDQLCRRLKFPGGVCVNGRCKCDNFRNSEDAVIELSPSVLETFSSLEDEPLSETEEAERSSCSLSACEQYCHRLKLPGGACVNGRCKCDKFLSDQDTINISAVSPKDLVCIPDECEQQCRKIGFPGGACGPTDTSNTICRCNASFQTGVETFTPDVHEVTPAKLIANDCDLRSCEFICRTMKLARGACIAGRCQCFLPAGLVDENSAPVLEPAKNQSHGKCRQGLCDLICRKLKYDRGECVDNKCKCYKNGGPAKVNFASVLEPARNNTHGKCKQGLCDLVCKKLKYNRGECIDNKCKCYRDEAKSDNDMSVSKFSENLTKVKCTKRVCDRMCRSLDYKGGNCKNGKCWCYGPPKKSGRLMLQDTDNEEPEQINQDVSLEKDDNDVPIAERAKVKCTKGVCDRMCRSLDYKGGNCKNGKCWCYGPPKKPARSGVEEGANEEEKEISLDDATEKAPPMYRALNEEEKEVSQDDTTEKAPPMYRALNEEEKEVSQDDTTEKVKSVSRVRRSRLMCNSVLCRESCKPSIIGLCINHVCYCF
ncbi:tenascin-like isoform X2 [Spodoptera litura]|uniref:Tenascin-like isoform X2 n=1 Tax=Spodoptera litura TaxID=69820 RepID=A0A9J7EDN7_SPOLT|nr:tenascin-like isoform X2 [Spodoptera litura]